MNIDPQQTKTIPQYHIKLIGKACNNMKDRWNITHPNSWLRWQDVYLPDDGHPDVVGQRNNGQDAQDHFLQQQTNPHVEFQNEIRYQYISKTCISCHTTI